MNSNPDLEKEVAEARTAATMCDDIILDRPLASIIEQLQAHREYLEKKIAKLREEIANKVESLCPGGTHNASYRKGWRDACVEIRAETRRAVQD